MTKNKITITWLHGSEYEAARVAGTFLEVKEQFFQYHQFLVLPYPAPQSVYLPDIDYVGLLKTRIPTTYHPIEYDKTLLQTIMNQLATVVPFKNINPEDIRAQYDTIQHPLITVLTNILPDVMRTIKNIYIIPTAYGTEGSFDYKKTKQSVDLYIWIRTTGCRKIDIIAELVHCLVSGVVLVLHRQTDSKNKAWQQREAIIDFLLQHTPLSTIWNQIHKTIPVIESKQKSQKLVSDSEKYIEKLSSTLKPPVISKIDGELTIDTIPLTNLTDKEIKLFGILLERKNTFVSKDELFDRLYGVDGGSDWSLSKLIERLRNKIVMIGVDEAIIITSRNQGYKIICS